MYPESFSHMNGRDFQEKILFPTLPVVAIHTSTSQMEAFCWILPSETAREGVWEN